MTPRVDGQLVRRGNDRWLVRIFLGRDSQTGKRQYHNETIKGEREAKRYLRRKLHEIDTGVFVKPSRMTLGEYLDRWLETAAKPRLCERTYGDYEYLLGKYVRPTLGSKKLSQVRPLDVQSLYTNLQEQGLSARTVRYVHTILSSAFKQAVRWCLAVQNPAAVVELPKQKRKEMQALSPENAARFLVAAAEDRCGLFFKLALVTGARPSECLGLKWEDVDFQKCILIVRRTVCWRKDGGWYLGEPKTPRSRRSIPLPVSVARDLMDHKRKQGEERLKLGPKYQNNDLIFATSEGTPLMLRNLLRRHFRPILKSAGLPASLRQYDLRHACATLLHAEGENPKVVSERLGHASITLTLDTYSHVLPSMQQAATDKLEKLLFTKTGTQ